MRLLTIGLGLLLAGCASPVIHNADANGITIETSKNTAPIASEHCSKYGKRQVLRRTEMTDAEGVAVYYYDCR